MAVCGLMLVGQGLIRTGALEPVGRFLARLWRKGPAISLLFTILITATLSAFINNTPIVVLMLPILIGVAVRTGSSPSGTLIPMGFASIFGGMSTTIGTSTNLLVVNVAADMGMDPFNMFDFLGPAVDRRVLRSGLPVADRSPLDPGPATPDERCRIPCLHSPDQARQGQPGGWKNSGGRPAPGR